MKSRAGRRRSSPLVRTTKRIRPGRRTAARSPSSPTAARIRIGIRRIALHLIEPRAGATEKPLAQLDGADSDALDGLRPQWSPDGRRIAYLQGGAEKWIYYAPMQLALIDASDRRRDRAGPDRPLVLAGAVVARRQVGAGADRTEPDDPPVAHRCRIGQGHAADVRRAHRCRVRNLHGKVAWSCSAATTSRRTSWPRWSRASCGRSARTTPGSRRSSSCASRTSRSRARTARRSTASSSSRRTTCRVAATRRSCASTAGPCTSSATSSCPTGRRMPRAASSWSRPIRAAVRAAASTSRARSTPTGATRTCRTCWPRSITSSRPASRIRSGSASVAAAMAASSPTT